MEYRCALKKTTETQFAERFKSCMHTNILLEKSLVYKRTYHHL